MIRRVVLAAGGTGGHMFPALALAAELDRRELQAVILTDRRGARYVGPDQASHVIAAGSPSGAITRRVAGFGRLALGTFQSLLLLLSLRPAAVAVFGGYASVPVALAAWLLRRPILIHEQNAILGRANRLILPRARLLALSLEQTRAVPERARARRLVTGNPVRHAVAELAAQPRPGPGSGEGLDLVVVGGSQGARVLSDVVPAAIARLPAEQRRRLCLTQQCRPEDLERVRKAYDDIGFEATLAAFFDDLPERLARADLVISRSGASSVAELLALARPSFLVPYRHAADDHQRANAEALVAAGAAWMVLEQELTPEVLAARLEEVLAAPGQLARMAARARSLAPDDPAGALADAVQSLLGQGVARSDQEVLA